MSMNEDSIKLAEEVSSGAIMAVNSFRQLMEFIKDEDLQNLVKASKEKHEELESKAAKLLENNGREEKEPGLMASAMSWTTTEMKLMINPDNRKISKIIMDGCNMGIQGISEKMNEYANADEETRHLANLLVEEEEKLMKKLREYL